MEVSFIINPTLSVDDFISILDRSTLGLRRPLHDQEAMRLMLVNANYYIGAYYNGLLVGIARAMTDYVHTTYLADLAVDQNFQEMGIGKKLIVELKNQIPKAKLILLSAPAAEKYYPKINMQRHHHCYFIDDVNEIN